MPQIVEADLPAQLLDEYGALGARPDKAHVAVEHVQQLRNLVHAQLAQHAPYSRDARIARGSPTRDTIAFRIQPHRAQLQATEDLATATTLLEEQHRRACLDEDGDHGQQQDRQRHQQQQQPR